jgi:hypothetical protein
MAEDTRKRPEFSSDYSSSAPRESGGDPLAELARLIGQNDPFNDLSKRSVRKPDSLKSDDRPAPEWLARPAAPDHDEYDAQPVHQAYAQPSYPAQHDAPPAPVAASFPPQAEQHAGHYADDQPAEGEHAEYAAHENYQPDDRYRVALPSTQYEPDSYYAEDGHMPPQGDEGVITRRRGGLLTIAAVLGLAVIGTAGAFGYRAFTSGGSAPSSPPVIKADPTPPKTVPAPATTASTDSKPFQDRVGAPASAERVVPREEQPVSLPAPAAPRITAPQPSAQAAAPLVSPPPPTSVNEPKKVKTVIIRQDSTATDSNAMASAPAAAPPAQSRTPSKQAGPGPMAIAPQSEPPARSKIAARTPAPAAPAASGAYVVQVSAQRTEAEAQSSYQALQSKYPSVLGSRNPNIRRVDLADKGGVFYRAQVGSFATSEQATAFCNSLKDVGGQCIVQKN